MNLLLFSETDRIGSDRIRLHDYRLKHLQDVINANEGDRLRVGEIDGRMGEAELVRIAPDEAILDVSLNQDPPDKLPLSLVLALPRPKMLRRILRTVAELGVSELHLINSYRVEKSFWQSPVLDSTVIDDYFLEGLAQSRDTVLPRCTFHKRFKPFVEDVLPSMLQGRKGLLAHPGEHPPCPRSIEKACVLVIGPEGGFIPYEVEKANEAGCTTVSLGPRILRVENAVSALVSQLY
ncbi:MAG: 16S rRNA (uracil(1498)-N(3))-methyltransferase [Pseudomonadota bacterium]